jgi:hypothetical protein
MCLGGSPAGMSISRFCTLTLAATLMLGGAVAGLAQATPDAAKPAAKPLSEKKPASAPAEKIAHGYLVHQSIELGGRITNNYGSSPMWDTLVNQTSGMRVLGQSLELRSVDTSKTPFFDTLTTNSSGFGGDPYDFSYVKISKGRFYDFSGNFRRDRNYFNYNLLDNSLLTTTTAAAPVLIAEPSSLHVFNTVRRNTDTTLTLFPLAMVNIRAGFNHGTHEGPSYSTVHNGGDIQVLNWFRNGSDTYTAGVDVKVAKRTTVSYDQFFVFYKGDSSYQLAPTPFTLSNGQPVSLGVDVLGGNTTCGSATAKPVSTLGLEVSNGIVNPYCSGTVFQNQATPTRTHFPTEQLRFSSHYFDKVSFNGRLLYSGATSKINSFNETFNGLDRSSHRQTIVTGAGSNGQFAYNTRINTSGDFGVIAEINKFVSISDTLDYTSFRNNGSSVYNTQAWTGVAGSAAAGGKPAVPTTSMLTPISDPSITVSNALTTATGYLNQQSESNTLLATASITSQFKLSGGWRFKNREVADSGPDDLIFHENGLILGAVVQPSNTVRFNVNYDQMNSAAANSATLTNTFTREAPNKTYHIRARATFKPTKWVNFAVAGNDFWGKNDDPFVNHSEHSHDFSFGTSVTPTEGLSLDFNYAYDDVYSNTDLCYVFTPNPNAPLPFAASNSGTCVKTAANPNGATTLLLGSGHYDAPSHFISGSFNYAPRKFLHLNGGARLNKTDGSAEMLNPYMAPGALQSNYLTPFADVQANIAPQWTWHGNFTYDGYAETGTASPTLPARNTHGNILTLGVKYAF